jgi:hypothetical protein
VFAHLLSNGADLERRKSKHRKRSDVEKVTPMHHRVLLGWIACVQPCRGSLKIIRIRLIAKETVTVRRVSRQSHYARL